MKVYAATPLLALIISGCSAPSGPSATMNQWSLSREQSNKGYTFTADARLHNGKHGWFAPRLVLIDDVGCMRTEYLESVHPISAPDPNDVEGRFDQRFDQRRPLAKVTLSLLHQSGTDPRSLDEVVVFSEERIVDPNLSPTNVSPERCTDRPRSATREDLRERAKTDPEGANAEAIDNMSRNEVVATAINTAGYLCARVTRLRPAGGDIIADCVEYRNGSGRVRYRVRTDSMTVEPIE